MECAPQSQSNTDNNNSKDSSSHGISKPVDNNQFITIWNRDQDKKRLLQIVNNNQLRDCPQAQKTMCKVIDDMVGQNKLDNEIYDKLHDLVHNVIIKTEEYTRKHKEFVDNDRRSSSRTYQITNILKQLPLWWDTKDKKILDVGCSEGAITAALGQEIGIRSNDIHGCDVREVKATEGFQFKMLEDPHKLPWENDSFSIVTALMSLHHVEQPTKMLQEISRVLRSDGILLIREHNCNSPELSIVFDLMHGFYAMVWAEPREMDDFRKHFADYHDRKYWTNKIEEAGFEELNVYQKTWTARGNEFANPMEHYFAVFKKKENVKLQVLQRQYNDRYNRNPQHDRNYNVNNSYNNYQSQNRNHTSRPYDNRRDDRRDIKRPVDDAGIDNSTEAIEKRRKRFGSSNENSKSKN